MLDLCVPPGFAGGPQRYRVVLYVIAWCFGVG